MICKQSSYESLRENGNENLYKFCFGPKNGNKTCLNQYTKIFE